MDIIGVATRGMFSAGAVSLVHIQNREQGPKDRKQNDRRHTLHEAQEHELQSPEQQLHEQGDMVGSGWTWKS